jgi:hypothetical protein
MEQTAKPKKSIKTVISITALAVLLGLAASTLIFWGNITVWIKSFAHNALTVQIKNYIGGDVSFDEISFVPAGEVTLTNVSVHDGAGDILARSAVVRVYYSWHWSDFDIKKVNLRSLAYIERIYLQKCEIFVREANNRMELIPLLKVKKSDGDFFKGQIQLGAAKINLNPAWSYNNILIDEVNGSIDFKSSQNITIDLTGKLDKMPLIVKGNYFKETDELTLENGAPFNLSELNLKKTAPVFANVNLKEGILENVNFSARKISADNWQIKATGEFSGLSIDEIERGRGSFSADNTKIKFADLSFALFGEEAAGEGDISWEKSVNDPDINFTLAVPLANPARISLKLTGEERVSIDVLVAGTLKTPKVSGNFAAARLNLDTVPVSNITGNFQYTGDYRAVLSDVKGETFGGTITASGDLFLDNHSSELDIAGKGLDSFLILGKEVQGKLDFNAHMSSRSENTITKGNFVIREGKAYGTTFQIFNGFFVKQNGRQDLSGMSVRTVAGSVYPDALNEEALTGSPILNNEQQIEKN